MALGLSGTFLAHPQSCGDDWMEEPWGPSMRLSPGMLRLWARRTRTLPGPAGRVVDAALQSTGGAGTRWGKESGAWGISRRWVKG